MNQTDPTVSRRTFLRRLALVASTSLLPLAAPKSVGAKTYPILRKVPESGTAPKHWTAQMLPGPPLRSDVTLVPDIDKRSAEDLKKLHLDWIVFEDIGYYCIHGATGHFKINP